MVLGVFTFAAPWLSSLYSTSLISAVIALIFVRVIVWWMYLVEVNHAGLTTHHANGFNRVWLKPLFSFGSWITLSNIIGPVMMYMDRFVIVSVLGVSSVAFYVAPYEVVTKLLVIPAAISTVLFPFFARSSVNRFHDSAVKLNQGLMYSLVLLYPLCLIGTYFSGEWLSLWLGQEFSEQGRFVVIWLVAGILLNGISQVLFAKVQGFGRSDWTAILHLLELLPYLLLLWYGLKEWGIAGAAFAWFVRVLIDTVGLVFLVGKINSLNLKRSAKTLITIFFATIGLLIAICLESFGARVAVFSFLFVAYSIYAFIKIRQEKLALFFKGSNRDSEVQDA
jgi:O-antigen/teichoic acid export membrane protein